MKRIAKTLMTAACILAVISLHAQLPQGIKYQAVARDSDGDLIINDSFIARFTVLQGTAMSEVYKEVHHVNTNKFGLFNLVLGEGAPELGTFATIDWGADEFHLKVEIDQGDGFVTMGTSRFFSVPYSLYSEKAGEVDMSLDDLADVNAGSPSTGQVLKWDGSVWLPGTDDTGGGSFTAGTGIDITGNVISNTGDTDATDDITTSTVAGGDLNGIYPDPTVAGLQGRNVVGTAPADGQALKWSVANNRWEPQNDIGGGSGDNWGTQVAQTDATLSGNGTAGNELAIAQQSASGGQVLKWDGSSWSPGDDDNTTYTNGTGIDITGTTISNTAPDQTVTLTGGGATSVSGTYPNFTITSTDNINDADADPTNELQSLSLSGNQLTLSSSGGTVTLPTGTTYSAGTGLSISGNIISNTGDADASDDITTSTSAGGDLNGTYPNPTVDGLQGREVANTAPADGQALKWSAANNRWEPQNDIGGGSGDDWGAQVALTDATLSGNGTAGNELRIAQQSASGGQVLKWDGSSWSPGNDDNTTYTNGTGIDITGTTISNTAPDQTVTLTGGGATSVSGTYPNFTITSTDNINDADADPTNELQTISKSGSTVTLSDGGGSFTDEVNDADADPNNELQTLSISGSDLTISNGNTVSLPSAGVSSLISDADNDTKVQTEESADEDIIRFDLGGTEFFRMDNGRIEVVNTGQSVFFGEGAGENDDFTSNFNTAIGYKAMNSNTNGANNVAVGANALEDNTTGASNTALGSSSLHANLTGFGNVAVGDRSMQSNQDGGSNTAVGAYSLYLNT